MWKIQVASFVQNTKTLHDEHKQQILKNLEPARLKNDSFT